ncbi:MULTISPECIES: ATP-dependent zinc metalloprotease FtsH [Desulfococcus]|jgi:cell division protease FtsH|uniref:ATP-dependent zinc metalloprotease FtsH n=1 Tax=Desulfococcus multivorans DSM 2059 TaxID=1121405 RepID=S7VEY2_DESML|nr:ATP-dependent zinc metalloprotease FtsH [Desulfococcus multivorans]AOY59419.1 FtsH3: cell division protease [Desulfococcus multivorans]AQV01626.1 cell division protein FtsH [Desulfococcus multivorans]EPR43033.1 peptidase M41 FtsH domain protein [Desulfococcus multivorans DSM 2059]MDX9818679.1 ATP-dependent zinc metalloprotease FtsH [Desulfococcus multivorans]SKA00399.1 cell division protease FtsH [Desulfococcus multivorans DSM 2059]
MKKDFSSLEKTAWNRNYLWRLMIWIGVVFLFIMWIRPGAPEVSYTLFKDELKAGNVETLRITGEHMRGSFKEPVAVGEGENAPKITTFQTIVPTFENPVLLRLIDDKVPTVRVDSTESSWLGILLIQLLPWILIIGAFVYFSRRFQNGLPGQGGIFGFGKSKARRYQRSESDTTFDDVAGMENTKAELQEIVAFLKAPEKFSRLGGKLPKGILLAGPPGTGKTLMARATAGEADVPFYAISGSEFIEMFVGVGASRVRDMFAKAKKEAPAIIFIDEIDSIGRARGTGLGGGHDEREQTLNQILAEMDGFSPHEAVVVMAATNRPDILDPALIRPGRFDRRVTIELPDRRTREKIIEVHARKTPCAESVDFAELAALTIGFSGADLENLVNEAAIIAARQDKQRVDKDDFDVALDKIRLGPAREDLLNEYDRKLVAYHEAGHTLVARHLEKADPVKKVTIIPHGQALGLTEQIPEEDRRNVSRSYLLDQVTVLMAGRAAEKIALDDISSGAADDIKKATALVRRMVCRWGMNDALGPVHYGDRNGHPFLGKELSDMKSYSEATGKRIDEEIRKILIELAKTAEALLVRHRDKLDELARELMIHETLESEDLDRILGSKDA